MRDGMFGNGVEPGGLKSVLEIKILLSYLLGISNSAVSEEVLKEVVLSEGIANYFDYSVAFNELLKGGQILKNENGELYPSETGKGLSREFYKMVPFSVREKCGKAYLKMLARDKSKKENRAEIVKKEDGYVVSLEICDIGSSLLKLDLLVPDENTASTARELFYSNTDDFYGAILGLLSGDTTLAKKILENEEN
jgi:hypothetical protein